MHLALVELGHGAEQVEGPDIPHLGVEVQEKVAEEGLEVDEEVQVQMLGGCARSIPNMSAKSWISGQNPM